MSNYIPKPKQIEAIQFTGQEEVFGYRPETITPFVKVYRMCTLNEILVFQQGDYIIKDTWEVLSKEEFEERYEEVER